jgi:hypothetical protein
MLLILGRFILLFISFVNGSREIGGKELCIYLPSHLHLIPVYLIPGTSPEPTTQDEHRINTG